MKTSLYIPDKLHEELKAKNAPISQIAQKAFQEWLTTNGQTTDLESIIQMIESGTALLKTQVQSGRITAKTTTARRKKKAT